MRYIILIFAVALGACSEVEMSPLSGTNWRSPTTDDTCGSSVTFGDGEFTWTNECRQAGGSSAYYVANGDFSVDGNRVTMTTVESTCGIDQIVPTLIDTFSIDGDSLHLSGGHGMMFLSRSHDVIAPVDVGCFEINRGFVPRPLTPL